MFAGAHVSAWSLGCFWSVIEFVKSIEDAVLADVALVCTGVRALDHLDGQFCVEPFDGGLQPAAIRAEVRRVANRSFLLRMYRSIVLS